MHYNTTATVCLLCGKQTKSVVGQITYFHPECRKAGRFLKLHKQFISHAYADKK